jgi:hypothetical protein
MSKFETNPKPKVQKPETLAPAGLVWNLGFRNYLKTLNVLARSAATRPSESLAGEIASLRSQGQVRSRF